MLLLDTLPCHLLTLCAVGYSGIDKKWVNGIIKAIADTKTIITPMYAANGTELYLEEKDAVIDYPMGKVNQYPILVGDSLMRNRI